MSLTIVPFSLFAIHGRLAIRREKRRIVIVGISHVGDHVISFKEVLEDRVLDQSG